MRPVRLSVTPSVTRWYWVKPITVRPRDFTWLVFMPPQPMLHRRNYFALSVAASVPSSVRPVFRTVPKLFFSLWKNTEQISMKFAGGNRCHEQSKWLHFGRSWTIYRIRRKIKPKHSLQAYNFTMVQWYTAHKCSQNDVYTTNLLLTMLESIILPTSPRPL